MTNEQTLINTLLENGLAASLSEAQRMATDMISTSDKVNESMNRTKDNYMVSNFKEQKAEVQEPVAPVQAPISGTPKEQRIQELRQNAINPQPVNVQTHFDTPANDQKAIEPTLPTAEPTLEVEHTNDQPTNFSAEPEAPQEPQMTPEDYAAQRLNDLGATIASDLTVEAPQVEVSTSTLEAGLPEQTQDFGASEITNTANEAQSNAMDDISNENPIATPNDFISQEPAVQEEQSFELPAQTQNNEIASASNDEPLAPMEPQLPVAEPIVEQQQEFSTPIAEPIAQFEQPIAQAPEEPQQEIIAEPEQAPVQEEQQQGEVPVQENKRKGFTAEEQKLADDVDLSKVFNFSNK